MDMKKMIDSKHFGFLGCGQMGQALVKGLLSSEIVKGSQITVTDQYALIPENHPIEEMCSKHGVQYTSDNSLMAKHSDVVFLCVKPYSVCSLLTQLREHLNGKLIVSVAAGVTLSQMQMCVPDSSRIIRIMPNTPCLVRCGTGVYDSTASVTPTDISLICTLCAPLFPVFEPLPESLFNAATALSGSGPAYIFMIAEALAQGGVLMGLPHALSLKLAINTILGSAMMMKETGKDPALLRHDVCSPGGTTIQAIHALEQGNLRATLMNAIVQATNRADQLAQPKTDKKT